MADIPVWLGVGSFKVEIENTMKMFMPGEELKDDKTVAKVKADIRHCFYKFKTSPQEYFLFGFRMKTDEARNAYLPDRLIMKSVANKTGRKIHDKELNDKFHFYELNKRFFKREVMLLNNKTGKEDFARFALKYGRIITKPNKSALGSGVQILQIMSKEDAYEAFLTLTGKCQEYVVEEVIRQDDCMAAWNASSVNTIRMTSFMVKGNFSILCPFIRTGRKGSVVDNGGQGGVFASIDKDTGMVCTDGMDERGNVYVKHPDSSVVYKGWQLPRWKELVTLTEEVHRNMPKHVYVGWDFALTDNGWVLIEGNWGEFVCQQVANGRGYKKEFLSYLNA